MSEDLPVMSSSTATGGDGLGLDSRAALMARLAERQAGAKSMAQQRRQRLEQHLPGGGLASDFLSSLVQTKTGILADVERKTASVAVAKQQAPKIHEITEFLDSIMLRIEALQKTLNDAAPYLTHFDTEQARMELKSLNSEFQAKREQLLPTKKFSFSRAPKPTVPSYPTPVEPPPDKTEKPTSADAGQSVTAAGPGQSGFDERFSLVGIQGPRRLELPREAGKDSSVDRTLDQSVFLADLTDCEVQVVCVTGNLVARRLQRCRVYAHPVAGSVWLEDCTHCDLVFACRQLRIHGTRQCRLGLHTASRPIIETCSELLVGPYPLDYPRLRQIDMPSAGLREDVNLWQEVEDFSHPNKRLTTGSPNWSILPQSEWKSLNPTRGDDEKG